MLRIDTNQDGKIDYNEFMAKFKTRDLDVRLQERARDKMARIKELMILHMNSTNDAFKYVRDILPNNYFCFSLMIASLESLPISSSANWFKSSTNSAEKESLLTQLSRTSSTPSILERMAS